MVWFCPLLSITTQGEVIFYMATQIESLAHMRTKSFLAKFIKLTSNPAYFFKFFFRRMPFLPVQLRVDFDALEVLPMHTEFLKPRFRQSPSVFLK